MAVGEEIFILVCKRNKRRGNKTKKEESYLYVKYVAG